MTLFIIILFLFSLFFTFDNKPINLLLDFIGIILSLSFYLLFFSYSLIDLSFFSFIFIIIYGSALAILFAFIIMLFNSNEFKLVYAKIKLSSSTVYYYFPIKLLVNLFPVTKLIKFNSFLSFFTFLFLIIYLFYIAYATNFLIKLSCFAKVIKLTDIYTLPAINFSLITFIYSSFIFNFPALILIINILLLGLIGAVFLLI